MLYAGSHLNDSIYAQGTGQSFRVPTVTLDDFSRKSGLVPSLIKMDIEGAEFDALCGMPRLIAEARPVLILEQSPDDMRCHELLGQAGYAAVDLASYRTIRTSADFPPGTSIANVLFVHRDFLAENPYFADAAPQRVAELDEARFERQDTGSIHLLEPMQLPPGRYLVRADFAGSSSENEVFAGVHADGETIFRYHTNTQFLANSYRDWPIHLDKPARIQPFLNFLHGSDPDLIWRGVVVWRLPAFDGVPTPVLI